MAAREAPGEVPGEVPGEMGRYGRRKPRPGLTPAVIVAAARRLVAREGLENLSMRRVADELGVGAMSLYRHVADREDLIAAMVQEIAEGLPLEAGSGGPRERLVGRLGRAHDYLAQHLWVLQVLVTRERAAEGALPFDEANLADLLEAGCGPEAAAQVYRICWQLLLGELLDRHVGAAVRQRPPADPDRFPALARSGPHLEATTGADDGFCRALEIVLDGAFAASGSESDGASDGASGSAARTTAGPGPVGH